VAKVRITLVGDWSTWGPNIRRGRLERGSGPEDVLVEVVRDADGRDVEQLKADAQVLSRTSEPSVLRLLLAARVGGQAVRVYEAFDGVSLAHILRKRAAERAALPTRVIVEIASAVARALSAVQGGSPGDSVRIVHPGPGPADVLVDVRGDVKVAGFRVVPVPESESAEGSHEGAELGAVRGTYGLGAFLVELLTGSPLSQSSAGPGRLDPLVSRALTQVLSRPGQPAPEALINVLRSCLDPLERARPSLSDAASQLDAVARRLPRPGVRAWAQAVASDSLQDAGLVEVSPDLPTEEEDRLPIFDDESEEGTVVGGLDFPTREEAGGPALKWSPPAEPRRVESQPAEPHWPGGVLRLPTEEEDRPTELGGVGPSPDPGLGSPRPAALSVDPLLGRIATEEVLRPTVIAGPAEPAAGAPVRGPAGPPPPPRRPGLGAIAPERENLGPVAPPPAANNRSSRTGWMVGAGLGIVVVLVLLVLARVFMGGAGLTDELVEDAGPAPAMVSAPEATPAPPVVANQPVATPGAAPAAGAAPSSAERPVPASAAAPGPSAAAPGPAPPAKSERTPSLAAASSPAPASPAPASPAPASPAPAVAPANPAPAVATARTKPSRAPEAEPVSEPDAPARIAPRISPAAAPAAAPTRSGAVDPPPSKPSAPAPVAEAAPPPTDADHFRVEFRTTDASITALEIRCHEGRADGERLAIIANAGAGPCKVIGRRDGPSLVAMVSLTGARTYRCFEEGSRTCR
jgi:hypothetical protein